MSSDWQSSLFLNRIKEFPDIYNRLEDFKKNDSIGSPYLSKIDDQFISPNTLRHVLTLCDLSKHFGNLNDFIISELGVGYGATAFMVNTFFKPKSYHLLDLPDVQLFAKKYLSLLNVTVSIDPPPNEVDLFISEFCLSEFDDATIDDFYERYIKNSKNVYLMMNLHDQTRKDRFIHKMNEDFNMEILPEYPETSWPNYIIIGKK